MNKILTASILTSILMFGGCSDSGKESSKSITPKESSVSKVIPFSDEMKDSFSKDFHKINADLSKADALSLLSSQITPDKYYYIYKTLSITNTLDVIMKSKEESFSKEFNDNSMTIQTELQKVLSK